MVFATLGEEETPSPPCRGRISDFRDRLYLNVGIPGSGLSYRTKISSNADPSSPPVDLHPIPNHFAPTPPCPTVASTQDGQIASAPIGELTTEGLQELKRLINEAYLQSLDIKKTIQSVQQELNIAEAKLRNAQRFFIRFFLKSKLPERQEAVKEGKSDLTELQESLSNSFINVDFDFSGRILNSFTALLRSFEAVRACQAIWDITASRVNDRRITRSAAGVSLERQRVAFGYGETGIVSSRHKALRPTNINGQDIYFYPGFAMIKGSAMDFALLDIREISLGYFASRFIEEESVPSDSKVVDYAWKKSNKDGSRDRRFAGNYEIPIVMYGEIHLRSQTGLNEVYQISNCESAKVLVDAFRSYQAVLPVQEASGRALDMSLPASDLSDLLGKKSQFDELKPEELLAQKPKHWEFRLMVALLDIGFTPIREKRENAPGPEPAATSMNRSDFIQWVRGKLDEVPVRWITPIEDLINNRVPPSFGPPGQPGDPEEIKRVAREIILLNYWLLAWWSDAITVRNPLFTNVHICLGKIAEKLFAATEKFPHDLYQGYSNPQPSGHCNINVTLSCDDEIAKLQNALRNLPDDGAARA